MRVASVLKNPVSTIGEALAELGMVRNKFRKNYSNMLEALLSKNQNLVLSTVYNRVPEVGESALVALALFNEVILEEAVCRSLPVIDLRNICTDFDDYSAVSPIEPSGQGAGKIVRVINNVVSSHVFGKSESNIYT